MITSIPERVDWVMDAIDKITSIETAPPQEKFRLKQVLRDELQIIDPEKMTVSTLKRIINNNRKHTKK